MNTAIDNKSHLASGAFAAHADLKPLVPYIGLDETGSPILKGTRCELCSAVLLGEPAICPSCGARSGLQRLSLSTTGRLYIYTTVHRSLPGIPTPFIFAIVDLDGGGTVKGNLSAPLEDLRFDMPVRVVFEMTERTDQKGHAYLSYHFVKA